MGSGGSVSGGPLITTGALEVGGHWGARVGGTGVLCPAAADPQAALFEGKTNIDPGRQPRRGERGTREERLSSRLSVCLPRGARGLLPPPSPPRHLGNSGVSQQGFTSMGSWWGNGGRGLGEQVFLSLIGGGEERCTCWEPART